MFFYAIFVIVNFIIHSIMLQTRKDNIRHVIIKAASGEFLQKGFKNTSMRTISRLSGITLSNIYNYFKDKDEIFRAVLTPLLEAFENMFAAQYRDHYLTIDVFSINSLQKQMIDEMMVIPKQFRKELKMLLFNSSGSSLENFRDVFTDRYTQESLRYMESMKERYPHIKTDFSHFFLHTMCSLWLTMMGEIVTHDELSDDDIENFITEYITFGTAGWKAIMKI